jgi:2-keto-3-deoxy-6-phosphogluconate aldolase
MSSIVAIAAQRVVPVVRCGDAEDAVLTAPAAAAAGMRVVELTLTTPDVHEALRELRGVGLVLGLGSLLDEATSRPRSRPVPSSSSRSEASLSSSPRLARRLCPPCRAR